MNKQEAIDVIEAYRRNMEHILGAEHETVKAISTCEMLVGELEDQTELKEQTIYGYDIKHLAMIAAIMAKYNITPEKATEIFMDVQRVVEIYMEEQQELIRKAISEISLNLGVRKEE